MNWENCNSVGWVRKGQLKIVLSGGRRPGLLTQLSAPGKSSLIPGQFPDSTPPGLCTCCDLFPGNLPPSCHLNDSLSETWLDIVGGARTLTVAPRAHSFPQHAACTLILSETPIFRLVPNSERMGCCQWALPHVPKGEVRPSP